MFSPTPLQGAPARVAADRTLRLRVAIAAATLAAAAIVPAGFSGAAESPAGTTERIEALLRRAPVASAVTATPTAPMAPFASAPWTGSSWPAPRTALTGGRVTFPARTTHEGPVFRSPSAPPTAAELSGKQPGTLGFPGNWYGWSVTTIGDMRGDGVSDFAVGAPYLADARGPVGGIYFYEGTPDFSYPLTNLYGDQPGSGFGYSVAGVGDVNGDGYADLLVGAPFETVDANADAGKAYLFLGSAFGFLPAPAWTFAPGEFGARVGWSVGWAGDVNNDGYDDWIVGAPEHANGETDEGAAYLFLGGSGPLSNTPAWSYEPNVTGANFGVSVSTAGDMNADGFADIVVGANQETSTNSQEGVVRMFLGHSVRPSLVPDHTWTGGLVNAHLGYSVAAAGDVDGDGYADILMGAPGYSNPELNEGAVLVASGGPLPGVYAAPQVIEPHVPGGQFGLSVATAGDINGDGYADILGGAPYWANGGNSVGSAFVFVGSSLGIFPYPYDALTGVGDFLYTGMSVGTMGDAFVGDGRSEFWAGAPGGASVVTGVGAADYPGATESVAAQGYFSGVNWGLSAASADVNGDGYDDLIVGSDLAGSAPYAGTTSVYYGGPNAFPAMGAFPLLGAAPDWTYEGDAGDFFAFSLASAGDVNGDGYQDFIGGAPGHTNSESQEGEAVLFYGSPTGPQGGAPWTVEGNQANAFAGIHLAGDADFDGDGYDDVAVAAMGGDLGIAGEGLVRVYYGSKFGLSHTARTTLRGNQANADFGSGCAAVGDVNRDGYDDLVVGAYQYTEGEANEGHAFLFYGSPTGLHTAADQTLQIDVANAGFGLQVYRIGDVNGDGYADVAIGAPYISDPESNEGKLFVYLGSPGGFQTPASWSIESDQVGDNLGLYGISGGDLNLDGYADLIVGDPFNPVGGSDAGQVRAYLGSSGGLGLVPSFTETAGAGENIGSATGGLADFDGDGLADMFYTAPGRSLLSPGEGVAYVRFGGGVLDTGGRGPSRTLGTWRTDGTAPVAPGLRSDSQTAIRLLGRGHSPAGRTRMRLQSEMKPMSANFTFAGFSLSPWRSGGAVGANGPGSSALLDGTISALASASRYHWRSRIATRSPLFPFSTWIGTEQRSPWERHVSTAGAPLAVDVDPAPGDAGPLALAPAFPNPCRDRTALAFTLPTAGAARLALYDLRGRLVRTLFDGASTAGRTGVAWDGLDADGRRAPAGVYFVRLNALGEERVGKLVRID